jgi:hypothetical protein
VEAGLDAAASLEGSVDAGGSVPRTRSSMWDAGSDSQRFPEPGEDPIADVDLDAFLEAIERLVVKPMSNTAELLERGDAITRMYTTLSPDEMTVDPIFDFNPELDDVSSLHVRQRVLMCTDQGDVWTIDFDGTTVRGVDRSWPLSVGDAPANSRIVQHGTSGEGMVVIDNDEEIEEEVEDVIEETVDPTIEDRLDDGTDAGTASESETTQSADGTDGEASETDEGADEDSSGDGEFSGGDEPSGGNERSAEADTSADGGVESAMLDEEGCDCALPGRPAAPSRGHWGVLPLLGAMAWWAMAWWSRRRRA